MKRIISMTMMLVTMLVGVAQAEDLQVQGCHNIIEYTKPKPDAFRAGMLVGMQGVSSAKFTAKWGSMDLVLSKQCGGLFFNSQGNYPNLISAAFGFRDLADKEDVAKFFVLLSKAFVQKDVNDFDYWDRFYYVTIGMAAYTKGPIDEISLANMVMWSLSTYDWLKITPSPEVKEVIAAMLTGNAARALEVVRKEKTKLEWIQTQCDDVVYHKRVYRDTVSE